VQFCDDPAVRHRIVFLPDYDIGMARYLYAGCDVWLNNPLRPLEACGTSGMKAALNGCLNLSIRDGWWDEMCDSENGWAIPTADGVEDPERRDAIESASLYELLENAVAARFYDRADGGVPRRWTRMVRHTLTNLGPRVLATRMVQEYVERYYVPAGISARASAADSFGGARGLAAWKAKVRGAWDGVHVVNVDSSGLGDTPQVGQDLAIRATVGLDGLAPSDVVVRVSYGRVDETDQLLDPAALDLRPVGDADGGYRFEGTIPLSRTGPFGYTVSVLPAHALLATPAEVGLITQP
jgi:starch phosphorylase